MPDDEAPDTGQDPVERLLDLCVYAPLGFVVDARRVVPDLAQRGRAQATMARMIGEFAVTWGNTKLQEALAVLPRAMPNLALDGEPTWPASLAGIYGPGALPVRWG